VTVAVAEFDLEFDPAGLFDPFPSSTTLSMQGDRAFRSVRQKNTKLTPRFQNLQLKP
jgi:hypothetical protein